MNYFYYSKPKLIEPKILKYYIDKKNIELKNINNNNNNYNFNLLNKILNYIYFIIELNCGFVVILIIFIILLYLRYNEVSKKREIIKNFI
jgi:hypothetical protein